MYFTEETKSEWGRLRQLWKCPSNHAYYFDAPGSYKPGNTSSATDPCPVCDAGTVFTGKTYVDW
jgi:hypothetical protein